MTSPIAGLDMSATSAAVPVPAATVLVLRSAPDGGGGVEVFCVRRHSNVAFLGGAVVFPGGKLDAADRELSGPFVRDVDPRALFAADADPREATALAIAACREALEEAAIIPAVDGTGRHLDAATALAMRTELESGVALARVLENRSARLDLGALVPFARWVTPEAERRRFDARFFLLPLPEGQVGVHDDKETTQGFWDTPKGVLARFMAGEVQLAPPTTRSLELLREVRSFDDAVSVAAQQSLLPVCPHFVPGDPPVLALPGDPAHPLPDARLTGPSRFVLREGKFVSEDAPEPA